MNAPIPAHVLENPPLEETLEDDYADFEDAAELLSTPPAPIDYLVDGLIPSAGVLDFSGPPGEGKSTLALHLAGHVATGKKWFHRGVKKARVLWITGEASSKKAIKNDLHRTIGEEVDLTTGRLTIKKPAGVMFRWDKRADTWVTTTEGARIQAYVRGRIGFVVIDTIGSVVAGLKEIDNDQQRQLARHLEQWGRECGEPPILAISHTNQSSTGDELPWRLHYLSRAGGNGFPGAIRWAAGLSRLKVSGKVDDSKHLGGRVIASEIQSLKLIAFGASKHNEMPTPEWTNFSPAIFEIRPDGGVMLIADGQAIALHQRHEAAGKKRKEADYATY